MKKSFSRLKGNRNKMELLFNFFPGRIVLSLDELVNEIFKREKELISMWDFRK
jgi:hypothetical protein